MNTKTNSLKNTFRRFTFAQFLESFTVIQLKNRNFKLQFKRLK
jgi:hypothetical protein